jgi:hypothetical protein
MNGSHSHATIRAVRGPIMMITVGVLFALQNFGICDFSQTWPVLLIVFGVLSLMQRGAPPPAPAPQPAPRNYPPQGYAGSPQGYAQSPYAQPPAAGEPRPTSSSEGGPV